MTDYRNKKIYKKKKFKIKLVDNNYKVQEVVIEKKILGGVDNVIMGNTN
jgi:hypothetical protein